METGDKNGARRLAVTSNVPAAGAWARLLAMTRDPTSLVIGETPVTVPVELASMPKAVHVAVVDADVAGSLLKVVKGVFAPQVLRNAAWPESVRDDLAAHAKIATSPGSPSARTSCGARPCFTSRTNRV